MLYIHQLTHLSPRMADLESVYVVRELKQKTTFPLAGEKLEEAFCEFFVSSSELQLIEEAISLVELTLEHIKTLLQKESPLYEAINLQRSLQLLKTIPEALKNNLSYLQQVQVWQSNSPAEIAVLFNRIPKLRTPEEKYQVNDQIKNLFTFLLRNPEFAFYAQDMVHEGPVAQISGLAESMEKAFFFHVSLEEEHQKLDFSTIKRRIPAAELEQVAEIERNAQRIKKGIDAAYNANMRMVNLSVMLYSYVKWLSNK